MSLVKNELDFLDFALCKLNDEYPNSIQMFDIRNAYYRKTDVPFEKEEDYRLFDELANKHNNKYWECDDNYILKLTYEYKEIIDSYGSLSSYLKDLNNSIEAERIEESREKDLRIKTLEATLLDFQNSKKFNKFNKRYAIITTIILIIGLVLECIL